MSRMIFFALFVATFVTGASAGECDTDLKSTDGYRELSGKLKCLSSEIADLKKIIFPKGGNTPAPHLVSGVALEKGGIRLELEKCTKSGPTIVCNLFITSVGKDQEIGFSSNSRSVDQNGVLYGWKGYQGFGEPKIQDGSIHRWFVSEVRTGAQFVFEAKTEQPAQALSVVQIDFGAYSTSYGQLSFRNIELR